MISYMRLLCGSAAVIALASGTNAAAQAADAASNSTGGTEIVVTAQKREQRLLDVPVAVTAINSQTLTEQGLNRLSDYYSSVPGLQYSGQRIYNIALRGVTTGGAGAATVAMLVDDVPFGSTTLAGQPALPDFDASLINQIEVLRGPQGTLYGASSLGGIIKYDLKQPDTTKVSGRVEASGSTVAKGSEGYALRGTLNIPLSDAVAVMVSGFTRHDAPYLDNSTTNGVEKDVNTRHVWGYRGAVLLRPAGWLTITASAMKQHSDAINSDLSIGSGGVPICIACTTGGTSATRATATTTFEPVYGDLTLHTQDSPTVSDYELYSGKVEAAFGKIKVTSLSAWGKSYELSTTDVTAAFSFLPSIYGSTGSNVFIAQGFNSTKFSQELRVSGEFGPVDVLVGGYYTTENSNTSQLITLSGGTPSLNTTAFTGLGPARYSETAGFADLTWHVTDKLDLQVGGRYAGNRQTSISTAVDATPGSIFGGNGTTSVKTSDNAFTWLITPTYHFNRDMMVYARFASGYRPGGTNATASGQGPFSPDRVVNYELGFKGRVIPGLLTIDTALFQIDWRNIQLQGTNPANSIGFFVNGGTARSRGLEFAAELTPWKGMTVNGNIAYTDATLTQTLPNLGSGSLVGVAGARLPVSARWAGALTVSQRFDLAPRLEGRLTANYTYVGDRWGAFNGRTAAGTEATRPRILIPSYNTVNLTAGVTYDHVWQLTASLRNATDERGVSYAQNRNGVTAPTALFIQPRTLMVTLARDF